MNQHDQMRYKAAFLEARRQEALGTTASRFYAGVKAAEDWQTLADEKPPLVRLTDEEIWSDDGIMSVNADLGLTFDQIRKLANAIMDAMQERNK